ncbi:hypothetical protein BHE74_00014745 [Ensete ventricosum]|nr:hypothetical protein GW17_00045629 [Ensete ventricosum]RWW77110.1 hypothetical protein BHE74_00014745 [Ensete ventricosum]
MEPESKNDDHDSAITNKAGFIQISPTREGPWTIMRLNYAAPAACWRFGNDVVASEVSVKNGNRYVEIRSLVPQQTGMRTTHYRIVPPTGAVFALLSPEIDW